MDARLLPPEQVWRDRKEALFRQFVAGLADVGVHPEQLLQNDNGGSRRGLRSCDIGGERAVMSFYGDVIVHCVLLRRRRSSRNPSINPCFCMERSVGTLNWFTTMLGWQVNQTGRVAIKNIEVERKKSKRRQGSHFARRLVSRGLGFLDRWCS